MKNILRLMPLAAALMLTGCVNLAPQYVRPVAPIEQAWPEGESYRTSELRREALPRWQDFILDERLKQVVETGLANNRNLRATALAVEQARAQYGVSRSQLFPTVAAVANESAQRTPGTMSPPTFEGATTHSYTAQLAMTSYELDFFGRVRNMNEQALQAYMQTEDAHRSAQSALIAEIAMTWLSLGADRQQLKLQEETLKSQEESYRLMEASYKAGAASRLDLEQARTTVAAARAAIVSYVRAVAIDKNALELLVGATVEDALLPDGIVLSATLPASMPEGLPSEVLLNRPDIGAAERSMIAANAQIGAARAAFFPSLSLTGGIGSGALEFEDLFSGGSGMWSFQPNISIPIFTGGLNLANLRSAEAAQKMAVANYEGAIQTAFREVKDALATEGTVERELVARRDYAESAQRAFNLSEARYKAGAAAYTEVLDAQRLAVSAQQALIGSELARASSIVTLYKVLGGGSILPQDEEAASQSLQSDEAAK